MFPENEDDYPVQNAVLAMKEAAMIEGFGGIDVVRALNRKLCKMQARCSSRLLQWHGVWQLIENLFRSRKSDFGYIIQTRGQPSASTIKKWGGSVKTSVFIGVRLPDGSVAADVGRAHCMIDPCWLSAWPELKPWPTWASARPEPHQPVTEDIIYQHLLPWAYQRRDKLLSEFPQGGLDFDD